MVATKNNVSFSIDGYKEIFIVIREKQHETEILGPNVIGQPMREGVIAFLDDSEATEWAEQYGGKVSKVNAVEVLVWCQSKNVALYVKGKESENVFIATGVRLETDGGDDEPGIDQSTEPQLSIPGYWVDSVQ